MSDSVREQVRRAWAAKQDKVAIESNTANDNVISLLSESEDEDLLPHKRQKTDVSVDDYYVPPFKPLHNPTYDAPRLSNSITLKDLIGTRDLCKTYLFSFQYSLPFLLENINSKETLITMVHQKGTIIDDPRRPEYNILLIEVPMKPFTSHHPKLIINFYDDDQYVKIFMISANLTEYEFQMNNQMIWESPILPIVEDSISTPFKENLIDWLKSYDKAELNHTLIKNLQNYDFSSIIGDFIASSAGSYNQFGYKSLYEALQRRNMLLQDFSQKNQLLYQSSSVGAPISYTQNGAGNIFTHLLYPLCTGQGFPLKNGPESLEDLKQFTKTDLYLIFPTVEGIRNSKFGYSSGGWSHYNPYSKNGKVQHDSILSKIMHKSYTNQRKTNPSHTKYLIFSKDDFKSIEWILFTSANLSKPAWGATQRDSTKITIGNYETGILISKNHYPKNFKLIPTTIGEKKLLKSNEIPIELPFKLPPEKYSSHDQPWCITKKYTDPDSLGSNHVPLH